MIEYEKKLGGWNTLFRLYGSAWPRVLIHAVPSAFLAGFLEFYGGEGLHGLILHPMPFTVFAGLVAFIILFRTNLSYARYWEGCTMVTQMSAKWTCAAIQVVSFDEIAAEAAAACSLQFRSEFIHMMSFMHALAMQRLRGDVDLITNLIPGSFVKVPPPPPRDVSYIKAWRSQREIRSYFGLRNSPGYFHRLWETQPLPVLGGVGETEASIVTDSPNPVYLLSCWIHRMLVARRMAGGIHEDAPIVARIYQSLSDGMLAYENARKICMTPFPFPYAQTVTVVLCFFALLTPLLMSAWLDSVWLSTSVTFLTVGGYFMLNEVAREIEEPFKYDPNDLPCAYNHYKFNAHLVTAFCTSIFPDGGLQDHLDTKYIRELLNNSRPQRSQPPTPSVRRSLDRRSFDRIPEGDDPGHEMMVDVHVDAVEGETGLEKPHR